MCNFVRSHNSSENYLKIIWESSENYLRIILKSSENHLKIIWNSSENYLRIIWELSENYLRIIWKSSENHLKVIWNSSENYQRETDGAWSGSRDDLIKDALRRFEKCIAEDSLKIHFTLALRWMDHSIFRLLHVSSRFAESDYSCIALDLSKGWSLIDAFKTSFAPISTSLACNHCPEHIWHYHLHSGQLGRDDIWHLKYEICHNLSKLGWLL